jgi:hypothetical protein
MAGVHFDFTNFKQLIDLNIGIADRLDENRAESFTILYCNFSQMKKEVIKGSLENVLRSSDAISNYKKDYFFVLPYTDKYGASMVKKMFDDFFAKEMDSYMLSYPKNGETTETLIQELQNCVSTKLGYDLKYLD